MESKRAKKVNMNCATIYGTQKECLIIEKYPPFSLSILIPFSIVFVVLES